MISFASFLYYTDFIPHFRIMAIMESTYPPHQEYAKKFTEELDLNKIHGWVKQQKMAVIVDQMQDKTLVLLPIVDRNDSKFLMIMKKPLYFQYTTIITTKTWPWIEQLNRIVSMQQESGIWRYWAFKANLFKTFRKCFKKLKTFLFLGSCHYY